MLISIASGKGGTGKTTLSLLLAAAHKKITLLDCDVEEPNCFLFLDPAWQNNSLEVTVTIPQFNSSLCTRCASCSTACLFNAIALSGETVLLFDELCHSCGGCVLACPNNAITERAKAIGTLKKAVSNSYPNINLISGTLKVGTPSAVPLIREMKRQCGSLLGDILVDCPPGTSCSMVAAVKDSDFCILVTEPTPFGKHDLELALSITKLLDIPTGVVINKSDNDIGDQSIKTLCQTHAIPILGLIPHSLAFAKQYADGHLPEELVQTASTIWKELKAQRGSLQ